MAEIENRIVMNKVSSIEREKAQKKIEYWKSAGMALLGDEQLGKKWRELVEEQANDEQVRGSLLDETLQILSLIKANVPIETISQIFSLIPSEYHLILISHLSLFVRPEILDVIQSNNNKKRI